MRSRLDESGSVVRSVIGRTSVPASRADCATIDATNESASRSGSGYWNCSAHARDQPAFDHDVPAPTATRWPARASARTDATA